MNVSRQNISNMINAGEKTDLANFERAQSYNFEKKNFLKLFSNKKSLIVMIYLAKPCEDLFRVTRIYPFFTLQITKYSITRTLFTQSTSNFDQSIWNFIPNIYLTTPTQKILYSDWSRIEKLITRILLTLMI